jgi:thioesterase domain-containing protein/protein-L-isoaspartate O-methyltransferase
MGNDVISLRELASYFGVDPVWGLQVASLRGNARLDWTLPEMAADLLAAARSVQPSGPYRLLGASFGGRVAVEMARLIRASGEEVAFLGLVDTYGPGYLRRAGKGRPAILSWRDVLSGNLVAAWWRLRAGLRRKRRRLQAAGPRAFSRVPSGRLNGRAPSTYEIATRAARHANSECNHEPPIDARIDLFRSARQPPMGVVEPWPEMGWAGKAVRGVVIHEIPGAHGAYRREPVAPVLAARVRTLLSAPTLDKLQGPKSAWESLSTFWDESVGDHGTPLARNLIAPQMEALLGPLARRRILDVGCGNGWFSLRMAEKGACVLGVDISKTLIERARSRATQRATFQIVDATSHSALAALAGDGPFDGVVSMMALMDIDPVEPLFESLRALLRPGGRLVFSTLDSRAIGLKEESLPEQRAITALPGQPAPHVATFRSEVWLRAGLARVGFRLRPVERLALPPGPRASWIADASSVFMLGVAERAD